jgi:hypothetical protein
VSTFGTLAKNPATGYAILGVVVVVGFVVIHSLLKQDVKDAGNVIKSPLGQGFDDTVQRGFNWLFGNDPDTGFTDSDGNPPSTYPVDPDFGLKNPAQGFSP